jgi:hypothetical protein
MSNRQRDSTSSILSRRATRRVKHARGSKYGTDQIFEYKLLVAHTVDSGYAVVLYIVACAATSQSLKFLPLRPPALLLKGHAQQCEQPSTFLI